MINKLQSVNPLIALRVFDVNLIFVYMIWNLAHCSHDFACGRSTNLYTEYEAIQ